MKDLRKVDPNDHMRRISAIEGGYLVRFTHCDQNICHKSFYTSKYGSIERALIKAQIWRNAQERRFKKHGTFDRHWSNSKTYYIIGLGWYQNFGGGRSTNHIRSYHHHVMANELPLKAFSITKYGLRGAFDLAVKDLSIKRVRGPYPDTVIAKAWRLLNRDYKMLSIV